jgi:hypothetical protein
MYDIIHRFADSSALNFLRVRRHVIVSYLNLFVIITTLLCSAFFFIILVCEAIGTAATPGLLCQPQVIVKMIVEKQMECRLAEEIEVLGENLPQRHFCPSQNPT